MGVVVLNDVRVNLVMPHQLYEKLRQEAKAKSISASALIRMICTEYLSK